jgi:KaiC/GvpD/RAD55 family RecA-like ATPase
LSKLKGAEEKRDIPATTGSAADTGAGRRKRSTGIIGLNLLLDGGFPEGTLIMVHGSACAGVDLAAGQFFRGDADEDGTYLKTEETISHDTNDSSGMQPEKFLMQMAGNRIVFDSFSAVIDRYGITDALRLLRLAKEDVQKSGANLMFIVFSGIHSPMEMTKLMCEADIVIEFRLNESQSELERTLSVQKIRDSMAPRRMLPFIITDRGIEASTTSRVV